MTLNQMSTARADEARSACEGARENASSLGIGEGLALHRCHEVHQLLRLRRHVPQRGRQAHGGAVSLGSRRVCRTAQGRGQHCVCLS